MTDIAIHESPQGRVEVRVDRETVWLSQRQMAELDEPATTEESSVVQREGSRQVRRLVKQYNLDALISVGYRINSKKAVQFRQ